jgi:hypothetical protein
MPSLSRPSVWLPCSFDSVTCGCPHVKQFVTLLLNHILTDDWEKAAAPCEYLSLMVTCLIEVVVRPPRRSLPLWGSVAGHRVGDVPWREAGSEAVPSWAGIEDPRKSRGGGAAVTPRPLEGVHAEPLVSRFPTLLLTLSERPSPPRRFGYSRSDKPGSACGLRLGGAQPHCKRRSSLEGGAGNGGMSLSRSRRDCARRLAPCTTASMR